ncbi:MAG: ABC transporter substrate-binding protein [Clostridiales bacterium]|jgi:NitT/TauT family transport system substrate-binding protein|nr:ABC transporter substrate-binding protein [Clostridiales bacterium]
MKNKIIAAVLTAVLSVGMMAGCAKKKDDTVVRVGSLKGPTTIGIVNLMDKASNGQSEGRYDFTMSAAPDEITAKIVSGDLDIALVPANLASVLYNKTSGGVTAIDINTLGVLYCVTGDTSITSINDLSGRKVITTGQGATPEYSLRYLLEQNGITDCEIEFRSESTEVAAVLAEDPSQIAVLPQPFVTVACAQNEAISPAFSLEVEWQTVTGGLGMVTGVTIVRNDFLKAHPEAVKTFIKEHGESVVAANSDLDKTASLVVAAEIIGKEPLAKKAIPLCNVVCMTGDSVKANLAPYLEVLYNSDPKSVGGNLPGDEFYYKG